MSETVARSGGYPQDNDVTPQRRGRVELESGRGVQWLRAFGVEPRADGQEWAGAPHANRQDFPVTSHLKPSSYGRTLPLARLGARDSEHVLPFNVQVWGICQQSEEALW
jgi:hypothetical protein